LRNSIATPHVEDVTDLDLKRSRLSTEVIQAEEVNRTKKRAKLDDTGKQVESAVTRSVDQTDDFASTYDCNKAACVALVELFLKTGDLFGFISKIYIFPECNVSCEPPRNEFGEGKAILRDAWLSYKSCLLRHCAMNPGLSLILKSVGNFLGEPLDKPIDFPEGFDSKDCEFPSTEFNETTCTKLVEMLQTTNDLFGFIAKIRVLIECNEQVDSNKPDEELMKTWLRAALLPYRWCLSNHCEKKRAYQYLWPILKSVNKYVGFFAYLDSLGTRVKEEQLTDGPEGTVLYGYHFKHQEDWNRSDGEVTYLSPKFNCRGIWISLCEPWESNYGRNGLKIQLDRLLAKNSQQGQCCFAVTHFISIL
jgi:hypothetical protein